MKSRKHDLRVRIEKKRKAEEAAGASDSLEGSQGTKIQKISG